MDDFETVRWGGLDSTKRAALNRIEAEAERLRDENQKLRDPYKVLAEREAEVERLKRVLQDADAELEAEREARPKMEAEVERLRAENDALGKMVELNVTALNKALDEAERLRAALERIADRDFGINKGERYRSEYARAALAKEES